MSGFFYTSLSSLRFNKLRVYIDIIIHTFFHDSQTYRNQMCEISDDVQILLKFNYGLYYFIYFTL